MRPALWLVGIVLLSACLGGSKGPAAGGAVPRWTLDCRLGSFETGPWTQRCAARASHTQGPKEETWLAINPKDPNNVVVAAKDLNPDSSMKCVWNGVFVSHDAGKTWRDVIIGGTYASRQPSEPWYGYACNTDPMFQFTKDGTLHYGVELYNFLGRDAYGQFGGTPLADDDARKTPGWKILLATSRDGGDTWPLVTTYAPDTTELVDDYSRMTVNPNTDSIIEGIDLSPPDACNVLVSRDHGASAASPVEAMLGHPCGIVVASPNGTVVLGAPGALTYWSRSTDDARTFSDPSPGFTINEIPGKFNESKYRTGSNFDAAYDLSGGPRTGTLYVVYGDSSRDEADVYVRASHDDGRSWGRPVMVNLDAPGAHQFMENIAVAGDGSVHVFYMDKQYDPGHKLIDITHAWSMDGGATWQTERVTNTSFDGDLGVHQRGFPFIGDYMGVAAQGREVWVGHPDASDGKTTVIAAAHVHLPACRDPGATGCNE